MGQQQSTCGDTNLAESAAICYAEATPGIDTWLTKSDGENNKRIASLSDTEKKSIESRNDELREALGLTRDGRNDKVPLKQTRYYTDCSDHWEMSTRWVTGGTIFPVFYMPASHDIDSTWRSYDPDAKFDKETRTGEHHGNGLPAFIDLKATHYGWSFASHARLTDANDPANQDNFPYGKHTHKTHKNLTHLYKAQGFYGITIPCDNTYVAAQKPKAIVINQLAYPGKDGWKTGPLVPFTRMVFMFVLGEYEDTRSERIEEMKHRVCTAWRDFIMQEIVFLDFCYEKPLENTLHVTHLRNFFGQVASMNEAYGWHQGLAIGKPKVWSDALSAMQARVATIPISGLDSVKRAQLSTLMSKYVFRIPPDVRALFLPDDEIRSGDEVQFVFDWPTCRRLALVDAASGTMTMERAAFSLQSKTYTINGATAGSEIKPATEIRLKNTQGSSSPALKLTFTGALKSGMRVQIHDANGRPLGIAHAHTPAAKDAMYIKPRTAAAVINLDAVALQANPAEHLRNWIVYKKRGVSAVPVSSGSPTALDATEIVFKPRTNSRPYSAWGCVDKDPNDATKYLPFGSAASKEEVEVACMLSDSCVGYYSAANWHVASNKSPDKCDEKSEAGYGGYTVFHEKSRVAPGEKTVFKRGTNPRADTAWGCADKDPKDATKNLPNSSLEHRDAVEVACRMSDSCVGYYSAANWHVATDTRPLECKEALNTGYTHFYEKTRVAPAAATAQSATGPAAAAQSASAVPATGQSATGQSAPAVPATGPSATTTTGPSAATTTGPIATATATGTATAASVAVISGDWGVSYALTSAAVADASLFSIDSVSYFGDKEKTGAPTRTAAGSTSTSTGTKRPLLGHTLSALVRSAVAYDAVEHQTLLSKIPRPSTIDESDASALGVLAVVRRDASGHESAVDFVCLASNARLAEALTALPSSRTLTAVSFAQMQLVTDFTASYFMASKKTKLGTVVCRAFRLVPYNIAAVVVVIAALVAISMALAGEQSPATRITRVFRARANAKSAT
jgi:hypothetical protein